MQTGLYAVDLPECSLNAVRISIYYRDLYFSDQLANRRGKGRKHTHLQPSGKSVPGQFCLSELPSRSVTSTPYSQAACCHRRQA